jgi:uncharacterized protein involved in response to NO
VLIAGNVVFHYEAIVYGGADAGVRIGLGAVILLIVLIGGRIIPSFTRNWLNRANPGRLPHSFSQYDTTCVVLSAAALLAWMASPGHALSGTLLLVAGVLQAMRLARWAGERTLAERLVLILHIGYAFVPLGFLLVGAAILWPEHIPASSGIHAWAAGAVGTMTLAVMTRASLGHAGQPLQASPWTQAMYAMVVAAALARVVAPWGLTMELLYLAAVAWTLAFAGFVFVYGPLLLRQRA